MNETEQKKNDDKNEKSKVNVKKRSGRHGARNQHRHKNAVKWIVETFSESITLAKDNESYRDDDNDDGNDDDGGGGASHDANANSAHKELGRVRQKMHLLDIAGGKGELAARLTLCHRLRVKMVDPRPADILDCFQKTILRSLPKKWQEKIKNQDANILSSAVDRRFQQYVMSFPSDSNKSMCLTELEANIELLEAVKSASLLLGMHADGATEAIVDVAIKYRKPFVVVPCCVFPNFFTHRFIPRNYDIKSNADEEKRMHKGEEDEEHIPVRSHDQFCHYLLAKDSHFKLEKLPFEGRNIAIVWDGKILDDDTSTDEESRCTSIHNS